MSEMVSLTLRSRVLPAEAITAALGLEPASIHAIGELKNPRRPEWGLRDEHFWCHEWPTPDDMNEDGLWERLLAPLREPLASLRARDPELAVEVWLKLEARGLGNILWLSADAMRLFADLRIEAVLDMYDSGKEGVELDFADALALWDLTGGEQTALIDAALAMSVHERYGPALLALGCVPTAEPLNPFEFADLVAAAREEQGFPRLEGEALLWRAAQAKIREWRHRHHDLRWLLDWVAEWAVESHEPLWLLYGASVWHDEVRRLGQPVPAALLRQVDGAVRDILTHEDP